MIYSHKTRLCNLNVSIATYDTNTPEGGSAGSGLSEDLVTSNYSISGSGTSPDPLLISFEYEFNDADVLSGNLPTSKQIVTCYMNPCLCQIV